MNVFFQFIFFIFISHEQRLIQKIDNEGHWKNHTETNRRTHAYFKEENPTIGKSITQ